MADGTEPKTGEGTDPKRSVGQRPRQRRVKIALPPKLPVPVRALWEAASPEAQRRAQEVAMVLLEIWLGRISRAEGAKRLGLTPVRLWQLSQSATSGLVAGLLKQPKARKGAVAALTAPSGPDPKALAKRVEELERETAVQRELIELLRTLPMNREEVPAKKPARKRAARQPRVQPAARKVAGEPGPAPGS